jgi:hypothetical protein
MSDVSENSAKRHFVPKEETKRAKFEHSERNFGLNGKKTRGRVKIDIVVCVGCERTT